jgi:hypothetical protein
VPYRLAIPHRRSVIVIMPECRQNKFARHLRHDYKAFSSQNRESSRNFGIDLLLQGVIIAYGHPNIKINITAYALERKIGTTVRNRPSRI